ncbi:N-acetylglucosamine-6-phosphate deacetylase [Vibrio tapetis subsp. quintayensis]|uniref:N-acetylglucosamine-6-phosphate deacetylase n=1 Tax=Vibrio tapetis TaxID=52443 RepID=UPI0025B59235|nr:N-acetylglucosamine-6-phosphate deacetylase [Vibrio tapetis]MDN3679633.1 N-acetylglucosamine-6-phosphate deacetylase [Vibrio tapetis subsp. quintayensis]
MESNLQHIRAGRVLVDQQWQHDCIVSFDELGIIRSIQATNSPDAPTNYHDVGNAMLLPGLVDSHVHGANNSDVMDASHSSLENMSTYFAKHGVTAFVATTVTAPVDKIKNALRQIGKSRAEGLSGAELLGGYLEGPYFTARHKGAHPEAWFRELDCEELDNWISYSDNSLITVALAPEKSNAAQAIKHLKRNNVKVMLGHTDANSEQVEAAFNAGADGIVHCYNGMRGLHHRDPGVVGVGLCHPNSYVEIIADGMHVHPTAIDVAHRCCGERLTLITDAMQAAGMPDGTYQLGEFEVQVNSGEVRTPCGSLAGSTLHLLQAVLNLSKWLNLPLEKAWMYASKVPAQSLSLENQIGTLSIGKRASMVALDEHHLVLNTWVNGKLVFSANPSRCPEALCI